MKSYLSQQFEFKPEHNSVLQTETNANHVIHNYNVKQNTVTALFDIEKAFDRVWFQGLVYKLVIQNYPPYITELINAYLANRNFNIKLNGKLSKHKQIETGVPQSSVLLYLKST